METYQKPTLNFHKQKGLSILLSLLPLFILVQFRPGVLPKLVSYQIHPVFNSLNSVWQIVQTISFGLILYLFFKKGKFDNFVKVYIGAILVLFISTILNGTNMSRLFSLIMPPLAIGLGLNVASEKGKLNEVIILIYWYLSALIILDFILFKRYPQSFVIKPGKSRSHYFLFGNYQHNFNWYVVFLSLIGLMYDLRRNIFINLWSVFIFIVMVATSYLHWSVTAMIALIATAGFMIIYLIIPYTKNIFNIFVNYLGLILFNVWIMFFNGLEHFKYIIENIFRKNVTLSSRTNIWERTVGHIKVKPFFGYGFDSASASYEHIGKVSSHNQYLNFLYNGGIFYFIAISILIYIAYRTLKKYKDTKGFITLSASLSGYFIYFLSEAKLNMFQLVFLLGMAYYIDTFYKTQKEQNGKLYQKQ